MIPSPHWSVGLRKIIIVHALLLVFVVNSLVKGCHYKTSQYFCHFPLLFNIIIKSLPVSKTYVSYLFTNTFFLSHTHKHTHPHTSTRTHAHFCPACLTSFLPPCSLKAEPNQLVCRNYSAINNEGQSAAAETGEGGLTRTMGPLMSACTAQDAGAS